MISIPHADRLHLQLPLYASFSCRRVRVRERKPDILSILLGILTDAEELHCIILKAESQSNRDAAI